jgi:uncharacterized protein (TIGR02646 family)
MRHLPRPPAPPCLATETPEGAAAQRARYDDLRYPSGGIKPRWNDLEKDEHGVGAVRRALIVMSDSECAYCGFLVGNDHMQVDHVLPQEHFPFVAYAWPNLLPTCDACNRKKLAFVPESLRNKIIVEYCLREHRLHDHVFDKEHLFGVVAREDRLIDPTFDDPTEHIEVLLDVPTYVPKSAIGRVTFKRLLDRRELVIHLAKVRDAARVSIDAALPEEGLEHFAKACGYPSLFRRFVTYWRAEREAGRVSQAGEVS